MIVIDKGMKWDIVVNVMKYQPPADWIKYDFKAIANELVERGFVVIAADMMHWGERGLYLENDPERIQQRTMDCASSPLHRTSLKFSTP